MKTRPRLYGLMAEYETPEQVRDCRSPWRGRPAIGKWMPTLRIPSTGWRASWGRSRPAFRLWSSSAD